MATDIGDRMRSNRIPPLPTLWQHLHPAAGGNAIAIADLTDWMDRLQRNCRGALRT